MMHLGRAKNACLAPFATVLRYRRDREDIRRRRVLKVRQGRLGAQPEAEAEAARSFEHRVERSDAISGQPNA
jgi:hypothetical protein